MLSVTVVTATIGDRTDRLRAPTWVAPDVRYLCVSDRPVALPPWEWLPCDPPSDPTWAAREWKVRLLERVETDVSLWLDAAFRLDVNPRTFLPALTDVDALMFPHPDRQSITEEAGALRAAGYDAPGPQAAAYAQDGLPAAPPLASTGFLLRRHTPGVAAFGAYWWRELQAWGHPRDQMSVNYAAWKTALRWAWLEGHYRQNAYAKWFKT